LIFLGQHHDSIQSDEGERPIFFLSMKRMQNYKESWAVPLSNMFNADYLIEAVSGESVILNMVGVPGGQC
jgi:hypothetical protein